MDNDTAQAATAAPRVQRRPKKPLIKASDISKKYNHSGDRIVVLDRLSFTLDLGETIGIVGASGIGKSTLLHVLGTLDRPDTGKLEYSGNDVLRLDDSRLARFRNRTIGFVFQFHHLLPEFSALENTMMPAMIGGVAKKTAAEAAEAILVRVGLKERLSHRASQLSGGEQQRVALARALVLKPSILLADEPTGNLDRKNSDQVHTLLMELNQEMGMSLIVVTHNLELAALVSRRVTIANGALREFH
ncbi:lipoprotein-releasing system ATP-binding protein LolD [Desulfosarcina alkanivorans]|jgi:lipoprotein-releasing system ATP-binding protein|uniref:Lipoprotein-releasing system ATP-binding protein LolD n=1 Tax=Desulfosarcina alkanivorans TaxID=571177 RepID=A0A5K7YDH1_9BACT|nr:ABC transporter ATP-binding protein [Desulfosarcina alkanivorans]BBO66485.1 lipoprotein-releasing system ATP-binding protein LolD [Desulfosarcina alkanivorans]